MPVSPGVPPVTADVRPTALPGTHPRPDADLGFVVDGTHATCVVWWAALPPDNRPLDHLVSDDERARASSFRQPGDRRRSLLAAALLRLTVARATGQPTGAVRVRRDCRDCGATHGRPRLPGTGLHASVSHSGWWVAVALTGVGEVGVDVEEESPIDFEGLVPLVLDHREQVRSAHEFYVTWTRKEALVKATGDGLRVPLTALRTSAATAPPCLVHYPGRPGMEARVFDLDAPARYKAALAVLTAGPLAVVQRNGNALFDAA